MNVTCPHDECHIYSNKVMWYNYVTMPKGTPLNLELLLPDMMTMTDSEVAKKHGLSRKSIWEHRRKLGLPKNTRWEKFGHLLGTMPDSELAKKIGVLKNAVVQKRIREGIPAAHIYNKREGKLQKKFTETLGDYEEYVRTDYGEIDILTDDAIYECKTKSTIGYIQSAVGQLLLYSNAFPNRELIIVVPRIEVRARVIEAVHKLGIEIITFDTQDA